MPHDLWDYDLAGPAVLMDVKENGATVPAVAHAGKTGWVYILDRRTGRKLRRVEFVPHENMFASLASGDARIAPGIQGGANWQPMACSPRTQLLYVRGQHTPNVYRRRVSEHTVGDRYDGGSAAPLVRESVVSTTAIDPSTGAIKWQTKDPYPEIGSPICGGALATGGDLVFYGDPHGFLNAADARTGKVLWQYQTGSWVRATPITYRIGGKQYVALTTLQGLLVFRLRDDEMMR